MMYNFKEIEAKWQKYWLDNNCFVATNDLAKPKYYVLVEFPYPSGRALHLGHSRSYTALDSVARKRRLEGYNVLFPMGWDAFGLPAENYAIKNKIHPSIVVTENVNVFKKQLIKLGTSFDWEREIATTDPDYYKWTQWLFIKFFEHGLAYKTKTYINWCNTCKIGLANEEVKNGRCERCDGEVIQKEKEQWMLKIRSYADKLIEGLKETKFLDKIKMAQINWIGKSEGAEIDFVVRPAHIASQEIIRIFTTRPDTLYGATFMVIAPEHPLIEKVKAFITNNEEVKAYQKEASKKSAFERSELIKEKTGVKLEGVKAINPVNQMEMEIWIADYVMMSYGTGAIMAVPAHDDRDFAFAKKFNLPIIPVIEKITGQVRDNEKFKQSIVALVYNPINDMYLTLNWQDKGGRLLIGGSLKEETLLECAVREIKEETGYIDLKLIDTSFPINHHYHAFNKNQNFEIEATGFFFELLSEKKKESDLDDDEKDYFKVEWVTKDTMLKEIKDELHKTTCAYFLEPKAYEGEGKMINSSFLNGLTNKEEAIDKIISYLEEQKIGKKAVNYRLQDWVFSRQRFWGEPIPMIYCEDCGWVAVPVEDLPVLLPIVKDYEPTVTGESPLANIEEFVNTTCPKCGKKAKRETDTMPNWAGSSWYWLRYMDPHNKQEFASKEALAYWGKVDWYNGGMEHATGHLLYARFWHRFLYDIGLVPTKEPFEMRTAHGMVLGEDGEKISKSKGNSITPDEIINELGADTLRTYQLFMGDYEKEVIWNANGLKGCKRFLDRVWKLQTKVIEKDSYSYELEGIIHKTIKKVTNDIETMKFNTAVAALMILLNEFEKVPHLTKADLRVFLILLNPIAPHITEEINQLQKLGDHLYRSSWPSYDEDKLSEDSYELVMQVNGKVRARVIVSSEISEEEIKELAVKEPKIEAYILGHEIIKMIVIPKKLINIVIK